MGAAVFEYKQGQWKYRMHLDAHGQTTFGKSVAINSDCVAVAGENYYQPFVSLYCEHVGFGRTQTFAGTPGTAFGRGIAFANGEIVKLSRILD